MTDPADDEDRDEATNWSALPQTQKYLKALKAQGRSFTTQLLTGYANMSEEQRAVLVGRVNGIEIAILSADPAKKAESRA